MQVHPPSYYIPDIYIRLLLICVPWGSSPSQSLIWSLDFVAPIPSPRFKYKMRTLDIQKLSHGGDGSSRWLWWNWGVIVMEGMCGVGVVHYGDGDGRGGWRWWKYSSRWLWWNWGVIVMEGTCGVRVVHCGDDDGRGGWRWWKEWVIVTIGTGRW